MVGAPHLFNDLPHLGEDYLSSHLVMPEVCQWFAMFDGFINRPDLSAFQLHPCPTLPAIYEEEQHIFIREFGNLILKGGEVLHI